MLRLPPTTVPLTRGEIAQYEKRSEERRAKENAKCLRQQNYITYSVSSNGSSTCPLVRSGPQRSVVYRSSPAPSSASSHGDTTEPASFAASPKAKYERPDAGLRETDSSTASLHQHDSRRDSVLSSEPSDDEASAKRAHIKRNGIDDIDGTNEAGSQRDDHWNEHRMGHRASSQSRTSGQLAQTVARQRGSSSRYRSLSDPAEATAADCASRQALRITSSASSSSHHHHLERIENVDESDRAKVLPLSRSDMNHISHDRHQSLPEVLLEPRSAAYLLQPGIRGGFVGERTESNDAILSSIALNSLSPLERVTESFSLGTPTWSADLPRRSSPNVSRRFRFPDFRDDDDDTEVVASPDSGSTVAETAQHRHGSSLSPSAALGVIPTRQAPRQLRRARPLATYNDRPSWEPGRSMRTEFGLETSDHGRNPLSLRSTTNPGVRRRPLPSSEQENEAQMAAFHQERRNWVARQNAAPQGRLEATPSPPGRLERLMR